MKQTVGNKPLTSPAPFGCQLVILAIILLAGPGPAIAQEVTRGRIIKKDGDFKHPSGMKFPEAIDGYPRTEIKALEPGPGHVSVGYDAANGKWGAIKSTVFVFPGLRSNIHTLRILFLQAADAMTMSQGADSATVFEPFTYKKDDYIIQGLLAVTEKKRDMMALFQCGQWMFKIRISAEGLDKGKRDGILLTFLNTLDPTKLVKDKPWRVQEMTVVLYPKILAEDSLSMCALMAAVIHKGTVDKLTTSRERQAGTPGLYIQGFLAGLEMLVVCWEKSGKMTEPEHSVLLEELLMINEAGFLREYVYDELEGTVIEEGPSAERLDAYRTWKAEHKLVGSVYYPFYSIAFPD